MSLRTTSAQHGAGLIEVVIACALVVTIIAGIGSMYRLIIRSSREVVRGTQASLLAEEGLEAARIMRDNAWRNIASSTPGTSYTLVWNSGTWTTTTTPALIDGTFDRRVVFSSVNRDSDDHIAATGTVDPGTRKVDVTVSWNSGVATSTRTMSTYLDNLF